MQSQNGNIKRILHIVSAMNRGGAETLLMNVYRNLDKTKIQFDFVVHREEIGDFDDEIKSLGGILYRVPSLGKIGPISYVKELIKIMTIYPYFAVHAHTDYQCGFPALAAKLKGVEKRVSHSHSNNWSRGTGIKEKVILNVLQTIIKFASTELCACSTEAAEFLYGKKTVRKGKVNILRNGIELRKFVDIDINSTNSLRKELNIPQGTKIIGHIGHFSQSKNQIFLINLLKKMLDEKLNLTLVLVGEGPLKKQIEEEAGKMGIINHIRFLGVRSDIPRLMKAFDVFVFPSLFEGFGIVALEAQSVGTPCVVADTVPRMTDMGLELMSFISLEEKLETWSKKIQHAFSKQRPNREVIMKKIITSGFNIEENVLDWLTLYGISS